jgi:hypothetical protein
MNWINTIITCIGLILLGWYQRYRIQLLQEELNSQKSILEKTKGFFDLFDLNKVKDYVQLREETISMQKGKEIEKIKSGLEENLLEKVKLLKDRTSLALDMIK